MEKMKFDEDKLQSLKDLDTIISEAMSLYQVFDEEQIANNFRSKASLGSYSGQWLAILRVMGSKFCFSNDLHANPISTLSILSYKKSIEVFDFLSRQTKYTYQIVRKNVESFSFLAHYEYWYDILLFTSYILLSDVNKKENNIEDAKNLYKKAYEVFLPISDSFYEISFKTCLSLEYPARNKEGVSKSYDKNKNESSIESSGRDYLDTQNRLISASIYFFKNHKDFLDNEISMQIVKTKTLNFFLALMNEGTKIVEKGNFNAKSPVYLITKFEINNENSSMIQKILEKNTN